MLSPPPSFNSAPPQTLAHLCFRPPPPRHNLPIFQSVPHNTQGIMKRPVRLIHHMLCATSDNYRDSLRVLGVPDIEKLVVANFGLLYRLRLSQRVFCKILDASNDSRTCCF